MQRVIQNIIDPGNLLVTTISLNHPFKAFEKLAICCINMSIWRRVKRVDLCEKGSKANATRWKCNQSRIPVERLMGVCPYS